MKITEVKEGVILEILVKPNSKKFRIVVEGDEISVFCQEEPVKGKVNKELIKEFSKLFRRNVALVSGFSSRHKRLLIKDIKKSELECFMLKT